MPRTRPKARLVLRRSVGGFGGSRRFFGTSRGQLPLEDIAFMCQSQRSCGQRGRWFWLGRERIVPPREGPPILLGKQRAPLGGYPRGAPLGSLLHPFLERKGWRAVPAAKPRCGFNRNKVAGIAYSVSNKTKGASSRPGRGPPAGGGYRAGGQCPLPDRAVVPLATKTRATRQYYK